MEVEIRRGAWTGVASLPFNQLSLALGPGGIWSPTAEWPCHAAGTVLISVVLPQRTFDDESPLVIGRISLIAVALLAVVGHLRDVRLRLMHTPQNLVQRLNTVVQEVESLERDQSVPVTPILPAAQERQ